MMYYRFGNLCGSNSYTLLSQSLINPARLRVNTSNVAHKDSNCIFLGCNKQKAKIRPIDRRILCPIRSTRYDVD